MMAEDDHILWDWELATNRMHWSGVAGELFCCEADEIDPDPRWWHGRIHPEERCRVVASLHHAVLNGAIRWSASYHVLDRDRVYVRILDRAFVIRQDDRPVRVVGVLARDALPQRRQEEHGTLLARLEESERQFRTFVESLPLLAWTATPDGWLDFYNQRWYEYTGTTFEEMEGWGWSVVHDAYDLPRMLRVWSNALLTGTPWEDEFRLRRGSDGMLRWHLSRAMPLRDEQGRIVRWFGTNTDIHDQKLALEERELLLTREQLARRKAEAASRAKDEFLAVVSHELRTPLNAIVGWTHLLRSGSLDADKQATAIERIERNARLQTKLVEDLLDVARIISDKFQLELQALDATVAVEAAIDAFGPDAEARDIAIELVRDAGCAPVLGNAERLQQVVGNLLGNAIKFSEPGQRIEVRLVCEAEQVRIEVQDRGKGIPASFLPHLFERFRQADSSSTRQHGGLGLGLSIARHLIELQGGHLTACSEGEGKGATFAVTLPVLSRAAPVPGSGQSNVQGIGQGNDQSSPLIMRPLAGIKVLGVDDEASARDVMAEVLLACGATVTMAGSVQEALRCFKLDRPDVVVSDIAMPGVDGYGLVERVRALADPAAAATPLIALTAYASAEDRRRALGAGFDHHLAKPLDPVILSNLIAEIAKDRVLAGAAEAARPRDPSRKLADMDGR